MNDRDLWITSGESDAGRSDDGTVLVGRVDRAPHERLCFEQLGTRRLQAYQRLRDARMDAADGRELEPGERLVDPFQHAAYPERGRLGLLDGGGEVQLDRI